MWSHLIVVSTPSLAFSNRVVEAHEPVLVQAFRSELAVEGLDERVVGRFARPAEAQRNPTLMGSGSSAFEMNSARLPPEWLAAHRVRQ